MLQKMLTLVTLVILFPSCKCHKTTTEATQKTSTIAQKTPVMPTEKPLNTTTAKSQQAITMAEYTANTRGYYLLIKLEPTLLSYTNTRGSNNLQTLKLTTEELNELHRLANQIPVNELQNMIAPTQLRFHDGAPHANLILYQGNTSFNSIGFDHEHPPTTLEPFINKLVSYIKRKN